MDSHTILILEDDPDRIKRFRSAVGYISPGSTIVVWESAMKMIAELDGCLDQASLISLDHDLYPADASEDPGDGFIVAKHLSAQSPVCPVIVHTSNVDRGNRMEGDLDLGGWTVKRVAPIGSDWIEADWRIVAKELLEN